jgi:hypothetical protein
MSKVKLPKRITVGRATYKVEQVPKIINEETGKPTVMGRVSFGNKHIQVSTNYPAAEVRNTFWHEITHAILDDMGSELTNNERFVTAFANRLSDAIDSAKF